MYGLRVAAYVDVSSLHSAPARGVRPYSSVQITSGSSCIMG
jgi:hypothetical protein